MSKKYKGVLRRQVLINRHQHSNSSSESLTLEDRGEQAKIEHLYGKSMQTLKLRENERKILSAQT